MNSHIFFVNLKSLKINYVIFGLCTKFTQKIERSCCTLAFSLDSYDNLIKIFLLNI